MKRIYKTESTVIDLSQWDANNKSKEPFDINQLKGEKIFDNYVAEKVEKASIYGAYDLDDDEEYFTIDCKDETKYLILNIKTQEIVYISHIKPIICNNNTCIVNAFVNDNGKIELVVMDGRNNTDYFFELNDNSNCGLDNALQYFNIHSKNMDAFTIICNFNSLNNEISPFKLITKNSVVKEKYNVKISLTGIEKGFHLYEIIKDDKKYIFNSSEMPVIYSNGDVINIFDFKDFSAIYLEVITNKKYYKFCKYFKTEKEREEKYKKIKKQIEKYDWMKETRLKQWNKEFVNLNE